MTIRITGFARALEQLDDQFSQEAADIQRIAAFNAYGAIKLANPVDTGRSRNAWNVGYVEEYKDGEGGNAGQNRLFPVPTPMPIYFTNGTDYIQYLNQGSSQQAPAMFIEQALVANGFTLVSGVEYGS